LTAGFGHEGSSSPARLGAREALFDAGWLPGRDAAGRVAPWPADFSAQADSIGRSHEIFFPAAPS
jgi:hypothetical protein